jgi:hypothetical protein
MKQFRVLFENNNGMTINCDGFLIQDRMLLMYNGIKVDPQFVYAFKDWKRVHAVNEK